MRFVDLMHGVPVRPVLNMPQLPGNQAATVTAIGRLVERDLFQLLVRREPLEVLDDTLCAVEAVDTSLLIDKVVDREYNLHAFERGRLPMVGDDSKSGVTKVTAGEARHP